ncbi:MAG: DUF3786 domain-containing protein [Chloroflexi bacterium]|nr:DUF3786 domain-containing protein [Chloroflexota bacterium]
MSTVHELLQKRQELLLPTIARLREELQGMDGRLLAVRAGADWRENELRLCLLGEEYAIAWPEVIVRGEDGREARPDVQVLLLTYLRNSDGTPPTGSWLSFRELPDGGFYHRAFQGYAPDRLAQRFGDDLPAFRRAAEQIGGRREPMGDAAYGFRALPHLWLAAVLWAGDEEFPAAARILFDETCRRTLATDLLATLGRWLVGRLLKAAESGEGG